MLSGQFARQNRPRPIDGAPMPLANSEVKPPIVIERQLTPPMVQSNLGLLKATYFAGGVFTTLAIIVSLLLLLRIFQ